jgi:hypothetical protein
MLTSNVDSDCRQVVIEAIGGCHPAMMRQANYTITVPFNRLSQKLRSLQRQGGKIIKVTISAFQLDPLPEISQVATAQPQTVIALEIAPEPEIFVPAVAPQIVLESAQEIAAVSIPQEIALESTPEIAELIELPVEPPLEPKVSNPSKTGKVETPSQKSQKPKTAAKSTQGFGKLAQPKQERSPAKISAHVLEVMPERPIESVSVEEIPATIFEVGAAIAPEPTSENTAPSFTKKVESAPASKARKPKTSAKAGKGFSPKIENTTEKRKSKG